jgi:hypothetical protein
MDKIPVGATIGHAYSYLFKNFLTIIGIMWLPFAILAVGAFLFGMASGDFLKAITEASTGTANFARVWYLLLPFYVFAFMLFFIQMDGLTRHALGLRQAPIYFYFSLGKPIWRLAGAFLLFFLLMIAIVVVFAIGGILIGMVVASATGVAPGTPPAKSASFTLGLAVVGIGAVAYCAFIYWIMRQSFLLTPVVVAEERIGLGRAWKLGRGNFWRMLVITLAIVGPIALIFIVVMFKFLMPGLPPTAAQGATADQIAAWNSAYLARVHGYRYVLLPGYFVLLIVFYGLWCSAQAFAYRSLVPAEKTEDVF